MDEVHNDEQPAQPEHEDAPHEEPVTEPHEDFVPTQAPELPEEQPGEGASEEERAADDDREMPVDPTPDSEDKSDESYEDRVEVQGGREHDDPEHPVQADSQQTEDLKPLPANLQTVKENEEKRTGDDVRVGDIQGGEAGELREEDLPKPDDSHNEPRMVVDRKDTAESHRAASGDPNMHIVKEPIRVDGRNRRSDEDGLEGHFVQVVAGDHQGLFGTFEEVVEAGEDGYPETILVTPRTAPNDRVEVAYKDVRPAAQARR